MNQLSCILIVSHYPFISLDLKLVDDSIDMRLCFQADIVVCFVSDLATFVGHKHRECLAVVTYSGHRIGELGVLVAGLGTFR